MERLRVGLIGCGSIGTRAHLPAIAYLRDRVTLVATADLSEAAARDAAAPWGATSYTDYRRIPERHDVDLVMIATPSFAHRDQVEAAAAAGKHVLCEKPMAESMDDADAMVAACRRAGVRFMIGHSRRFTRRYMEIRASIDRGEVGAIRLVRENERRPATFGDIGRKWTSGHWSGDPALTLGAGLQSAIHEMDLFRWFVGVAPASVVAEQKVTVDDNPGVPDFFTFSVRFANGAIGSSERSNVVPPAYPAYHLCELYGTAGAIRAKDHELISITRYEGEAATFPLSERILVHQQGAYVREWAEFVDAIRHHRVPSVTPEDARAALALSLAAIESARAGRAVTFGGDSGAATRRSGS